jgi:hypothetical protein
MVASVASFHGRRGRAALRAGVAAIALCAAAALWARAAAAESNAIPFARSDVIQVAKGDAVQVAKTKSDVLQFAKADDFSELRRIIEAQQKALKEQGERLKRQQKALDEQRKRLEALERARMREALLKKHAKRQQPPAETRPARSAVFSPPEGHSYPVPGRGTLHVPKRGPKLRRASVETAEAGGISGQRQPVGQPPRQERKQRPQVAIIPERGGVLTPRGKLVIEPSLEFTHTDVNRFTFSGVEVIDTVLIGVINAERANRDILTGALGLRLGVTNRFEVEAKFPYVYRNDQSTTQTITAGGNQVLRGLEGNGLGDIELGGHYQINQGKDGWPFLVANLRVKTATGKGPFDVPHDANGIETDLATGSGFWSLEPSVTILYPTDPAVLFANFGYLHNFGRDINKTIGTAFVGHVNPGNAARMSFGIGIALNDKTSVSLGYQHDFIGGTKAKVNGVSTTSQDLSVGQLNVGINYAFTKDFALNVNVGVGVTRDTPDLRLMVRVPVAFQVFN